MHIISFSLWGNNKLYCQGAIDNIEYAKRYYPDWTCRFYVAEDCPALSILKEKDCEVFVMPSLKSINRDSQEWVKQTDHIGMLWRFLAISDPNVDRVIFRDTDSRVNDREAQAVNEWIKSDAIAHRMHETEAHWNSLAMGGMWGIKGKYITNIEQLINSYIKWYPIRNEPWIFVDLWFIMDIIWPSIQHSCLGHGCRHPNPFPQHKPLEFGNYIGDIAHPEWRNEIYVG